MDFSCKNCFDIWVCSWCKNRWCDDTGMPFFFEGKPTYWEPTNVWRWDTYTKKEQKKMIAKYSNQPPTLSRFCVCEKCKNNYVDNNICKGRHKTKIKYEITNYESSLSCNNDIEELTGHAYLTDENGKAYLTDDDCRDAEGNLLSFDHECWKKGWANQVLKNTGVMICWQTGLPFPV
jgi:hypothetical protein